MRDRPNILLAISDQQRTDTLSALGRTPCRTPHADRLAAEGVLFERAICASPLCLPSRASLFTGQYPHQVDMMSNRDVIQAAPLLTDALREAGYHTAYAGKWHLEPEGNPKALLARESELGLKLHGELGRKGTRAIDRWFDVADGQGSQDYSTWCEEQGLPDGWPVSDDELRTRRIPSMSIPRAKREAVLTPAQTYDGWVTDMALRMLDERPKTQPFFLVCGWFAPHPPFKVPDPYFDMYDPADAPEPPNFGIGSDKPASVRNSYYHQLWRDHGDRWEAWRTSVAAYWGYTTMVDDLFGKLLDRLEVDGLLHDTLIIYCSDHGEMMGSHGLWHKMAPYEECLRVPLLMRLPGRIPAGLRSNATVSLIDVPATILSIVGLDVPAIYQGRDLIPLLTGAGDDGVRFSEMKSLGDWHGIADFRLVVDNRYKFVWHDGDRAELYDLSEDPFEQNNLEAASQMTDLRTRLSSELFQWMRETGDPLAAALPA